MLYERHEARLLEFSQKATITFVTMQILIILNTTHKSGEFLRVGTRCEQTYVTIGSVTRTFHFHAVGGKEVPSPYLDFITLTSFTSLDVVSLVPFDCMYETSFDHLDALLLESLVPLFMLVAALIYTSARRLHSAAAPSHKVLSAWLSMLFLVLPVISRRVCQSFKCDEFNVEGNEYVHYLSADR